MRLRQPRVVLITVKSICILMLAKSNLMQNRMRKSLYPEWAIHHFAGSRVVVREMKRQYTHSWIPRRELLLT